MESREGDARRLGSLDTLRGVAILLVILFHVAKFFPDPLFSGVALGAIENQGVQLFFLVSAYTMAVMWQARGHEHRAAIKFYIRRLCRIAPLYCLAIAFYALERGLRPPGDILLNVLLLHSVSPSAINSVVPGGWSIGVEVAFYLVFPLLARVRPAWLLAIGLAWYLVLGLGLEAVLGRARVDGTFLYYSPLTQFPVFLCGLYVHALVCGGARTRLGANLLLILGWLVIALAMRHGALPGRPAFWLGIALMAAAVWAVARWSVAVRPLQFLGRLSYSMYLAHFAVIDGVGRVAGYQLPYLVALAATVAGTIAIALLSFHTGEKWSQQAGRRLVRLVDNRARREDVRANA